MQYMFYNCSSLTSLNLSNFNTSNVINMRYMFSGCFNLEYINLNKFDEIKLDDNPFNYEKMFYNVPMNTVICLNENITENNVFPQIKNIACYTMDCTDDWKSKQKKIINGNQCIEYNNKNMSKEEEIEYYNNLIKIVEKH